MGLWNIFRKMELSGDPTLVAIIERRLQARQNAYKEQLQNRTDLTERNQILLEEIAQRDVHLVLADEHEAEELKAQQESLRRERQPIESRLQEAELVLRGLAKVIEEDEYLLAEAEFQQKLADRHGWLQGVSEDQKLWADALERLADLTGKMAQWEVTITAGEKELFAEAEKFGMATKIGGHWQPAPVVAQAREELARRWNAAASEREQAIRQRDAHEKRERDVTPLPKLPITDGEESHTTEDGLHTWTKTPLPRGSQEACTVVDGCAIPAVVRLTYTAPKHARAWTGCEEHGTQWVENYVRKHQHPLTPHR